MRAQQLLPFMRKRLCRLFSNVIYPPHPSNECICGLTACVLSCPAKNAHNWTSLHTSSSNVDVLAPYQGSPWAHIDAMLDLTSFKPGDRVLDLGAGDARVMIRALQRGASYVEGWELSSDVFTLGEEHIKASYPGYISTNHTTNISVMPSSNDPPSTASERAMYCDMHDYIRLYYGDARQSNPMSFDIVTMFLLPYGLSILAPWVAELWQGHYQDQEGTDGTKKFPKVVSQGWPLFPINSKEGLFTIDQHHQNEVSDQIGHIGSPNTNEIYRNANKNNKNNKEIGLNLINRKIIKESGTELFVYQ